MKVLAVVQARTVSSRLPIEVMKIVERIPIIEILFSCLRLSKNLSQVILATSDLSRDNQLASHIERKGFGVFRGSEIEAFGRFFLGFRRVWCGCNC